MKVKLLGTRGSYPASGPSTRKYGGNTPCIEIVEGGGRLILDAGTGILGVDFEACCDSDRIDIFLTHLHMDHIQGLAFFKPLFNPDQKVFIWGPKDGGETLQVRLNRFLSPPLFPIPLRDIPSQLHINEMPETPVDIGPFRITAQYISHPGPTLGYRVQSGARSITYLPDHEPIIGRSALYAEESWISGFDLAVNTDLLIHDSQYSQEEYQSKLGWGHSSVEMACKFGSRTGAKRLILFHHDPNHSDAQIDAMLTNIMQRENFDFPIQMAVEGMEIEV